MKQLFKQYKVLIVLAFVAIAFSSCYVDEPLGYGYGGGYGHYHHHGYSHHYRGRY